MNTETDTYSITSKTWLNNNPHFFVKSYIDIDPVLYTLAVTMTPVISKIRRHKKKSKAFCAMTNIGDSSLTAEILVWDALSDEALIKFEEKLD